MKNRKSDADMQICRYAEHAAVVVVVVVPEQHPDAVPEQQQRNAVPEHGCNQSKQKSKKQQKVKIKN